MIIYGMKVINISPNQPKIVKQVLNNLTISY